MIHESSTEISGTLLNEFMGESQSPSFENSRTDYSYWKELLTKHKYPSQTTSTELPLLESFPNKIKGLLRLAAEEHYEDGMENSFSRAIIATVEQYKEAAIEAFAPYVTSRFMNEETGAELIRCLARIDDESSYLRRLWLLERCLYSPSLRIRDAASMALASLDDPHAIPYLLGAVELERYRDLKDDMGAVITQLENTRSVVSA